MATYYRIIVKDTDGKHFDFEEDVELGAFGGAHPVPGDVFVQTRRTADRQPWEHTAFRVLSRIFLEGGGGSRNALIVEQTALSGDLQKALRLD